MNLDLYKEKPVSELAIGGNDTTFLLPKEFSLLDFQINKMGQPTMLMEVESKKSAQYTVKMISVPFWNNSKELKLTEPAGSTILGFSYDEKCEKLQVWVLSPCDEKQNENNSLLFYKGRGVPPDYKFICSCVDNNTISMFRKL